MSYLCLYLIYLLFIIAIQHLYYYGWLRGKLESVESEIVDKVHEMVDERLENRMRKYTAMINYINDLDKRLSPELP